ncbi:hypothetical protein L2E82_24722 [Cichorium intybus]|uniref:Uncharacterized protein n=1 Tax=Cichorium intybus TaxID=13427 RepID=A0ACB9E1J0_CICIN|nr:hypothetical protein L2E82_24722 [Cichorium intybus]
MEMKRIRFLEDEVKSLKDATKNVSRGGASITERADDQAGNGGFAIFTFIAPENATNSRGREGEIGIKDKESLLPRHRQYKAAPTQSNYRKMLGTRLATIRTKELVRKSLVYFRPPC